MTVPAPTETPTVADLQGRIALAASILAHRCGHLPDVRVALRALRGEPIEALVHDQLHANGGIA